MEHAYGLADKFILADNARTKCSLPLLFYFIWFLWRTYYWNTVREYVIFIDYILEVSLRRHICNCLLTQVVEL
jgi:hypothetical protein